MKSGLFNRAKVTATVQKETLISRANELYSKVNQIGAEIDSLRKTHQVWAGFYDADGPNGALAKCPLIMEKRLEALKSINEAIDICKNIPGIESYGEFTSAFYYARAVHVYSYLEEAACIEIDRPLCSRSITISASSIYQTGPKVRQSTMGHVLLREENAVSALQNIREQETDKAISDRALMKRILEDVDQAVAQHSTQSSTPDNYANLKAHLKNHPLGFPDTLGYRRGSGITATITLVSDAPHNVVVSQTAAQIYRK